MGCCLQLPEKDQKETCIIIKVNFVQPSGDCDFGLWKLFAWYHTLILKASMKGLGPNEEILTGITCSRTNQELQEINRVYKEM